MHEATAFSTACHAACLLFRREALFFPRAIWKPASKSHSFTFPHSEVYLPLLSLQCFLTTSTQRSYQYQ